MPLVDIIIPTYNNPDYLRPCLNSLLRNKVAEGLFHIFVVNNGHPNSCDWVKDPDITVLQPENGQNLGWEGGLKLGLQHSKAEFAMFLNDDTRLPDSSKYWLNNMLQYFRDPKVAAVGPSSNTVMGLQNIFADVMHDLFRARFLIFFCVLTRRSAIDEVGGVDDSLGGGDDLDMSIRLRNAGYKLLVDRSTFVFHHGFKTGTRIMGDHTKVGGWNSYEFTEKVDHNLIRKHGFRNWWYCMRGIYEMDAVHPTDQLSIEDVEGIEIRKRMKMGKIVDLGCGGNKTMPDAIGVDLIAKDDPIDTLSSSTKSQADICWDVADELPFEANSVDTLIARHILEHMIDPITVLKQWKKVIKEGGKLIIAVPNQNITNSIPVNPQHVHAFNPFSMKALLEQVGFRNIELIDPKNYVSFIAVAEKEK